MSRWMVGFVMVALIGCDTTWRPVPPGATASGYVSFMDGVGKRSVELDDATVDATRVSGRIVRVHDESTEPRFVTFDRARIYDLTVQASTLNGRKLVSWLGGGILIGLIGLCLSISQSPACIPSF